VSTSVGNKRELYRILVVFERIILTQMVNFSGKPGGAVARDGRASIYLRHTAATLFAPYRGT
jgi:hypothetical protein